MSNDTLYKTVLDYIDDYKFERLCEILLQYKFPNDEITIPTRQGTQDGGEDCYSDKTKTKYAFSIQEDWKNKVNKEIEKYIKHNNKQPETKKRNKLIYVTNKEITEPEWNKFCAKIKITEPKWNNFCAENKITLNELDIVLEKYDINTIVRWLEEYFKNNNNPELFYILGLSALCSTYAVNVANNTFGVTIEEYNTILKKEYWPKQLQKKFCTHNAENSGALNFIPEPSSLYDIFVQDLKSKQNNEEINRYIETTKGTEKVAFFKHYIIEEIGGHGKTFEMQRTVITLCEDAKNKESHAIKAQYYALKDYTGDILPWDNMNFAPSEPCYMFLDGFDELSLNKQQNLIKNINTITRNNHSIYFVITSRPANINELSKLQNLTFFSTCEQYTLKTIFEPSNEAFFLQIPFFRTHKETIPIEQQRDVYSFMNALSEYEQKRFAERYPSSRSFTKNMNLVLKHIANYAFSTLVHKVLNIDELYRTILEDTRLDRSNKDTELNSDRLDQYLQYHTLICIQEEEKKKILYFTYEYFQYFLCAKYLLEEPFTDTDIPTFFKAGHKGELLQAKYLDIFIFWLNGVYSKNTQSEELQNTILEYIKRNIQTLFQDTMFLYYIPHAIAEKVYIILQEKEYGYSYILSVLLSFCSEDFQQEQIQSLWTILKTAIEKKELDTLFAGNTIEVLSYSIGFRDIINPRATQKIENTTALGILNNIDIETIFKLLIEEYPNFFTQYTDNATYRNLYRLLANAVYKQEGLPYTTARMIEKLCLEYEIELPSEILITLQNEDTQQELLLILMGDKKAIELFEQEEQKYIDYYLQSHKNNLNVFFNHYITQYTEENPMPTYMRNFVLKVLKRLLSVYEADFVCELYTSIVNELSHSILHILFSLSENENKELQTILITSEIPYNTDCWKLANTIIEKLPSKEVELWLTTALENLKLTNQQISDDRITFLDECTINLLSRKLDDEQYCKEILTEIKTIFTSKYNYIVNILYDRNKEIEWLTTFRNQELEELHRREEDCKNLADKATCIIDKASINTIENDIQSIFDKDLLKNDVLRLCRLIKETPILRESAHLSLQIEQMAHFSRTTHSSNVHEIHQIVEEYYYTKLQDKIHYNKLLYFNTEEQNTKIQQAFEEIKNNPPNQIAIFIIKYCKITKEIVENDTWWNDAIPFCSLHYIFTLDMDRLPLISKERIQAELLKYTEKIEEIILLSFTDKKYNVDAIFTILTWLHRHGKLTIEIPRYYIEDLLSSNSDLHLNLNIKLISSFSHYGSGFLNRENILEENHYSALEELGIKENVLEVCKYIVGKKCQCLFEKGEHITREDVTDRYFFGAPVLYLLQNTALTQKEIIALYIDILYLEGNYPGLLGVVLEYYIEKKQLLSLLEPCLSAELFSSISYNSLRIILELYLRNKNFLSDISEPLRIAWHALYEQSLEKSKEKLFLIGQYILDSDVTIFIWCMEYIQKECMDNRTIDIPFFLNPDRNIISSKYYSFSSEFTEAMAKLLANIYLQEDIPSFSTTSALFTTISEWLQRIAYTTESFQLLKETIHELQKTIAKTLQNPRAVLWRTEELAKLLDTIDYTNFPSSE